MSSEDSDILKDYSKLLYNNFIINHYCIGMSRILILWIIKYYGPIHGYGILNELHKFHPIFIEEKSVKPLNPSNIYPILNKMEESGLISYDLKDKNNKKLKYFYISPEGVYLLDYIFSRFKICHDNDSWSLLLGDMD